MIVVTTPNGKIGSKLIPHLLAAGEAVRVIVRDPSKLSSEIRSQVELVQGSADDEAILERGFEGAESVFLTVPPTSTESNDTAYWMRFTLPVLKAMKTRNVKRLVAVSVLGRNSEFSAHAGPVTASLAKDREIRASGVDYRALWCPALMDNMLNNVKSIKQQGMFSSCSDPDHKAPQVATSDIGAMGSRFLLNRSWTGQDGIAVLGPEDLSFNQMAGIISEVLKTNVRFQQTSGQVYKSQLVSHGGNEKFAQGVVDMLIAKDKGLDNCEVRTRENTTPTGFRQWCEDVLKPAFLKAS